MSRHVARPCAQCGKEFSGSEGRLCFFCRIPKTECLRCGEPAINLPMLEVDGRRAHAGKDGKRCTEIVAERYFKRTGLVFGAPLHYAT